MKEKIKKIIGKLFKEWMWKLIVIILLLLIFSRLVSIENKLQDLDRELFGIEILPLSPPMSSGALNEIQDKLGEINDKLDEIIK